MLVLIGFMGAGKTTAANAVAERLNLKAFDTDDLLVQRFGTSIDSFFDQHGEEEFRQAEHTVVSDLLSQNTAGIVAIGGGAIKSQTVRELLATHTVILLDIDSDTAWQRVGGTRPLALDQNQFGQLYRERLPIYHELADVTVPARRDAVINALPSIEALRDAPSGTKLLWATAKSDEYPIYLQDGLLSSRFWPPVSGRRFLITDDTVGELYADAIGAVELDLRIQPGEEHKTLASANTLLRALATAGMARDDHIVALGGGVVGDLAGFCASVYQRGVGVIQLPTTLVAQVDSAYGGKTGVDLPEGKNYVGAFHHPTAVLVDPLALTTLPAQELSAGWAEVVKTALIAGGNLWERVRTWPASDLLPDRDLILACIRLKTGIVAADERDADRRQALNLGHTIGHAIELATNYRRYRHGEAVALGLLAALDLSDQPELRAEVAHLFKAFKLPTTLDSDVDSQEIVAGVQRDKKKRGGEVGFVLVNKPGDLRIGCSVDEPAIRVAVEGLKRNVP